MAKELSSKLRFITEKLCIHHPSGKNLGANNGRQWAITGVGGEAFCMTSIATKLIQGLPSQLLAFALVEWRQGDRERIFGAQHADLHVYALPTVGPKRQDQPSLMGWVSHIFSQLPQIISVMSVIA